jgi:hypothetical protein
MKLQLNITYSDNTQQDILVQAGDMRKWEMETKQKISSAELGMSDLLLLAYTALRRTSEKPLKPIDVWCDNVADIDVEVSQGNPTNAVASQD